MNYLVIMTYDRLYSIGKIGFDFIPLFSLFYYATLYFL